MIVVLMGVSGSGKTTVGKLLAARLGWTFLEGDDFHPPANVEKMHRGEPLNDDDRRPWLAAIRRRLDEACRRGENVVLACSALKHAYQDYLERGYPLKEAQGGDGLVVGGPGGLLVVQEVEDVTVGVVEAELVGGLAEVAGELAEVVDVDLDASRGAIAEPEVLDEALTQGSHGNPR
jgi:hypothetical protein